MKKIYLLALTLVSALSSFAQTVYTENMGTPAATTLITAYTGWQATAPIAYSGSGDVRTSTASSGYTGASGSGNVFLTSTAGKNLIISNINTSAYVSTDLTLSFGYLTNSTSTQLTLEKSTDGGTSWSPITFTNNTNTSWNLVSISGGQIPAATNLSLRFTQPATAQMRIDDVKIVNVSSSCALVPGAPTTACDASTLGIDTYTITIPYTGGGTASYTITATVGTVGGNNPNSVASGNIIITGTNEGVNNSITITGGTCNFTIPVLAPTAGCKPVNTLPLNEPFNYAAATSLNNTQMWTVVNTGDDIVTEAGNLTYSGISSTGNRATFAGVGAESRTPFTSTTSGVVYARFLNSITDLTGITAGSISYSALFTDNAGGSTNARIWFKENGGQYQYGLSPSASTAAIIWSSNLYNVGTTQYLLLSYNFATNTLALYENPTIPSTASPSVSLNLTAALTNVGGFMLRQDTAAATPVTIVDELFIDTTAPDALVLSTKSFESISGLSIYPNPAKTVLNITSNSFATKTVEIYNVLGTKVLADTVTNNTVNVASLANGVYVIKVTEEGKTATRKLVIE